jgi:aminoglycoside phosphotransferase (APT) family kinase protein
VFEEHGLVVTSWIDGPSLPTWLLRASASDGRLMIHQAGAWLARLHRAMGVEYRPLPIGGILGRLEQEIAEEAPPRRVVNRALALLHSGAQEVAENPVPWACSHGDFKPRNLIVRDGQLVGIDFDLVNTAPTLNDVAHFLNHLQLLFYRPRTLLEIFDWTPL